RARRLCRNGRAPVSKSPGRRGIRPRDRAACRCRAAHSQPVERRAHESGVQPRARTADATRQPCFSVHGSARRLFRAGPRADVPRQTLESEPLPQMFEPLAQNPSRLVTLLVRTTAEPRQMMAAVQAAVRQVAKDASVYGVTTLQDRLGMLSAQRRFQTSLLL